MIFNLKHAIQLTFPRNSVNRPLLFCLTFSIPSISSYYVCPNPEGFQVFSLKTFHNQKPISPLLSFKLYSVRQYKILGGNKRLVRFFRVSSRSAHSSSVLCLCLSHSPRGTQLRGAAAQYMGKELKEGELVKGTLLIPSAL